MTYYALDYSDPASVGGAILLNSAMMPAAGRLRVLIASGFDAWKATAMAGRRELLHSRAADQAAAPGRRL